MSPKNAAHDGFLEVSEFVFLALGEFRFRESRLCCIQAEHVDDDAPNQGENFRRVVFLGRAGILAEIDIEHPVKLVLHRPVRAHRLGHGLRRQLAR